MLKTRCYVKIYNKRTEFVLTFGRCRDYCCKNIYQGNYMKLKYIMDKKDMNIFEIYNYIITKYPKSSIKKIDNFYKSELIEACTDFFYYEKLNWCGCGHPDAAKRVIRDYLRILYDFEKDNENEAQNRKCINLKNRFGFENVFENELLMCLAYTLDAAGFTEHGSSLSGAWLSEEGKMFLWLLNGNG